MFLIAPTEPKRIAQLGKVSSIPENHGADIMILARPIRGLFGVQRKEISDLLASITDGRLGKEIAQMQRLSLRALIIEGRMQWTNEGELMHDYHKISRAALRGLLYSIRSRGVWVEYTDSLQDTITTLETMHRWADKEEHTSLLSRPGPKKDGWGRISNKDWGVHILTSFPGVGTGTAQNIYEYFGGVPLSWQITEKDLMAVAGVGKVRAKKMIEALEVMEVG